jgi:hypothetical protein
MNVDDASFLLEIDEHVIDGMLKSQQSKRSRAKSKTMTLDNYKTLMTAAIAENIIRLVTGREKSYTGARQAGTVDYTIEQLEAFAADQHALRKEIRNVQSKKSIMKSKADFSESDERWLALLKAEQMLKDLRVGSVSSVHYVEVDKTAKALREAFGEMTFEEVHKLKADEARELLASIYTLIADDEAEEDTTEE